MNRVSPDPSSIRLTLPLVCLDSGLTHTPDIYFIESLSLIDKCFWKISVLLNSNQFVFLVFIYYMGGW